MSEFVVEPVQYEWYEKLIQLDAELIKYATADVNNEMTVIISFTLLIALLTYYVWHK